MHLLLGISQLSFRWSFHKNKCIFDPLWLSGFCLVCLSGFCFGWLSLLVVSFLGWVAGFGHVISGTVACTSTLFRNFCRIWTTKTMGTYHSHSASHTKKQDMLKTFFPVSGVYAGIKLLRFRQKTVFVLHVRKYGAIERWKGVEWRHNQLIWGKARQSQSGGSALGRVCLWLTFALQRRRSHLAAHVWHRSFRVVLSWQSRHVGFWLWCLEASNATGAANFCSGPCLFWLSDEFRWYYFMTWKHVCFQCATCSAMYWLIDWLVSRQVCFRMF